MAATAADPGQELPPPASSSTSQSLSPSLEADPKEWERKSTRILTAIRCFVDGLRSAPCLKAGLPRPTTGREDCKIGDGDISGSLLAHLDTLGVMQQVQDLGQEPGISTACAPPVYPELSLGSLLHKQYKANERRQILRSVVIPLLRNLEHCYDALDKLPQAAQEELQSTGEPAQSQSKASRNRRTNKAPPPLGMLSLNDYTNVACLLEFAMSISLVPFLEYPNVYLPPVPQTRDKDSAQTSIHKIDNTTTFMSQKRNQLLPKALAGRIPKTALTWGTLCRAENHNTLCDSISTLVSGEDDNTHQTYLILNTYQAYNEITSLVTVVGHVLMLDRFRPMLLPRHLSDIYLMLLIAERLRWHLSRFDKQHQVGDESLAILTEAEKATEKRNNQRLHSLHKALLFSPLMFPSSFISPVAMSSIPQRCIDCREAALAYRGLLGGGASMAQAGSSNPATPPWLRMRLGQCLTKLAHADLQSVVEVFVASAHGPGGEDQNDDRNVIDDVMTGAASRLARALCARPTKAPNSLSSNNVFEERLCSQFVEFLFVQGDRFLEGFNANDGNEVAQSRSSMAMHLTLWATIAELPTESLQSYFAAKLSSGLMPSGIGNSQSSGSNPFTALQSTAAIASWLLTVPSSLEPSTEKKVHSLLLTSPSSLEGQGLVMFGQMLRLASLSVKEETNLIVEVNANGDGNGKCLERLSELTVAHMVHLLARGSGAKDTEHSRFASLASALLKAVSANEFDKKGYCFERLQQEHVNGNLNSQGIVCKRRDRSSNVDNLPLLAEGIQDRAKCLVRALTSLTQLQLGDDSPEKKKGETEVQLLTSHLFQLVVSVHFTTLSEESGDEDKVEPRKIDLNGMTKSERNELKIAATVLLAELCENCSPSALLESAPGNNESHAGVLRMLGLVIESAASRVEDDQTKNTEHVDAEELFSTAAIVLSLLVAVLEVGAEKRSNSDESFFKSLLSPLRVLSCGGLENDTSQSEAMTTMLPHLAEMASHAMALIAARGETSGSDNTSEQAKPTKKTRVEAILEKLSQAERDLQSSQPPLRAKGVVSLRHIARALIDEGTSTVKVVPEKKGLITEIHEPKKVLAMNLATHEGLAVVSRTLARICLDALADSESYVYLASIQTLVAISDVCPAEIMPLMGLVIAKGEIDIDVVTSDSVMASVRLSLTQEQRIKATEALIFMMRRRGPAIFLYGLSLLEAMLFGPKEGPGEGLPDRNDEGDDPMFIQQQTHSYFTGDTDEGETESGPQDSDEKNLRLNTGGPVYSIEENDVLRAGAISVVCELVSALDPSVVAAYCHHLVHLATNALQLEASRPVRRAAASLARELYNCVIREVTSEGGSKAQCESTMAIAMVTAKEERMYNSLSRNVSADEIPVQSKTRLVDPATQARCSEALDTRQELEDMGILQAAALIAHSLEQDLNDSKVQAVRRALSEEQARI